jgi:hypothetical protein
METIFASQNLISTVCSGCRCRESPRPGDGALTGTGDVKLGDVGTPTPFTAKKAK